MILFRYSMCRLLGRTLAIYWRSIFIITWPIMASMILIFFDTSPASRCAYVVSIMAIFWICEILPLPVTSLIPVVAFPLMGILPTETVCMQYFKETNMMFIGGFIVAIAVEQSNLHKRIALRVMLIFGTTHQRLTFGIMFCTMLISMWVSNTAATAMMAPIAQAILEELELQHLVKFYEENKEDNHELPYPSRTTLCYFLGVAYAASLGGIGTIVGTGTNLTFKGLFESRFPNAPPIDFGQWMLFNVPVMLLSAFFTWVFLCCQFVGLCCGGKKSHGSTNESATTDHMVQAVKDLVKEKYKEMGPMTFREWCVLLLFILVVCLWIFRSPGFILGWSEVITDVKVKDATPAMLVCLLFFILPATPSFLHMFSSDEEQRPRRPSAALLSWKAVNEKMPWGLVFLLGGGFALAEGSKQSGMSTMIGQSLKGISSLPAILIMFLCCLLASNMTEMSSNVAIANILLPVLAEMAVVIEVHPMYLMIPATLGCSFSFMMPVGTPPNALVAGMVNIRTKDMILAGIAPTIITLVAVTALFPSWGYIVYNTGEFPSWAQANNTTE